MSIFYFIDVSTSNLSTVNKDSSKDIVIIAAKGLYFRIFISIFIFQALERLAKLIRTELAENYIENIDT